MSDGTLSQDEIDALLKGTDTDSYSDSTSDVSAIMDESLSTEEIASIASIISKIIDSQSVTLKNLTNKEIAITNPKLQVLNKIKLASTLPIPGLQLIFPLIQDLSGNNMYYFKESDALLMGSIMMGQEVHELTEMIVSAVAESTSQMVGSSLTTIANAYHKHVNTGSPQQIIVKSSSDLNLPIEESFLLVTYDFRIDKISTKLYHIVSISLAKGLAELKQPGKEEVKQKPQKKTSEPKIELAPLTSAVKSSSRSFQAASFSRLDPVLSEEEVKNISLLLDVEMEVTVELGRAQKTVKEILSMGEGTIITLDRLAGESIDILVNGKPIAKGEVIVIEEYFGVRITEILSKTERINTLK